MDKIKDLISKIPLWAKVVLAALIFVIMYSCVAHAQVPRPGNYLCGPVDDLTWLLGVKNPKMEPLMVDEDGDEWAIVRNLDNGMVAPGFIDKNAGMFCVPTRGKMPGRSA